MTTLIFYVMLCTNNECHVEEPASWAYSNAVEADQVYAECSLLANTFSNVQGVAEVDCYVVK